jgi:hypothetical protein
MVEVRTLEVYFINDGNFTGMHDAYKNGDPIARRVWAAITNYLTSGPKRDCAFCEERLYSNITFVIMLREDNESLTAVICEDCSDRDDIDAQIEIVIRRWLPDAEFSQVVINDDNATRH